MNNIEEIKKEFDEKFRGIEQYGSDHKSRWINMWVNEVWNFFEEKLTQQREEAFKDGYKKGKEKGAMDLEWGQKDSPDIDDLNYLKEEQNE